MSNRNRNRRNRRRRQRRRQAQGMGNNNNVTRTFAPTAYGTTIVNGGAMNSWTIRHREFVGDIFSDGTGSKIIDYSVNPGLITSFPWLSQIATHFETYDFNMLKYTFVSVLASTANGAIAICPDYDAADDNSSHSKSELLSFQDTVRGSIWSNVTCACRPSNLKKFKQRFVRDTDAPSTTDIKTYDALQLKVLVTDDKTTGTHLGELWVEYSITLFTPQLNHFSGTQDYSYSLKTRPGSELTTIDVEDMFTTASLKTATTVGNLLRDNYLTFAGRQSPPLADNQFEFTKPGNYLMSLFVTQTDGANSPDFEAVIDSDTGDATVLEYSQGVSSFNVFNWLIKFACGALTSTTNPATVTITDNASPKTRIANSNDFMRFVITRMNGFSLPTILDGKEYRKKRAERKRKTDTQREKKQAPGVNDLDEVVQALPKSGKIPALGQGPVVPCRNKNCHCSTSPDC